MVRTGLSYAGVVGAGRDVSAAATQPTGVRVVWDPTLLMVWEGVRSDG